MESTLGHKLPKSVKIQSVDEKKQHRYKRIDKIKFMTKIGIKNHESRNVTK